MRTFPRIAMIVLVVSLTLGAATAQALTPLQWKVRSAGASTIAKARSGAVGFAVIDHRGRYVGGYQPHRTFNSASVFKTMLAVCFLNDSRVRSRALTASEKSLLSAMIRRSSDPAANTIYGRVRQSCIHRLAKRSGMRGFATSSFWGKTRITPYGTARLFHGLDRRIVVRHRALAMRWFRTVVPTQRWGLAKVTPAGMAIAFKGGFAGTPGGGHTISQGALLTGTRGHRIGVAVLTNHSPTAAYGHETIRRIGARLLTRYAP